VRVLLDWHVLSVDDAAYALRGQRNLRRKVRRHAGASRGLRRSQQHHVVRGRRQLLLVDGDDRRAL
jgi:hypothetical protein